MQDNQISSGQRRKIWQTINKKGYEFNLTDDGSDLEASSVFFARVKKITVEEAANLILYALEHETCLNCHDVILADLEDVAKARYEERFYCSKECRVMYNRNKSESRFSALPEDKPGYLYKMRGKKNG